MRTAQTRVGNFQITAHLKTRGTNACTMVPSVVACCIGGRSRLRRLRRANNFALPIVGELKCKFLGELIPGR